MVFGAYPYIGLFKGLPDAGTEVVLSSPLPALHLEHRAGLALGHEQVPQDRHRGLLGRHRHLAKESHKCYTYSVSGWKLRDIPQVKDQDCDLNTTSLGLLLTDLHLAKQNQAGSRNIINKK